MDFEFDAEKSRANHAKHGSILSRRNNYGSMKTGLRSQPKRKTSVSMCSLRLSAKNCGLPFLPIDRDAFG